MEKTQYFTKDNIGYKTEEIFNNLKQKVQPRNNKLNIERAALLILDMQRFFFNESSHAFMPSGRAIVDGIVKTAKIFHDKNRPIIATKHINTTEDAKMMDFWWRDILTEDSDYSNLIPAVENLPISEVIDKSQYDAFFKTDLNKYLHDDNIEQIIITGVITHLCCETTTRSAFVHGYNVFFPIDGTATYNEDIHFASLHTLAHGFANITTLRKLAESVLE